MISMDPPPGYESQDRMYQGNRVFITFPAFHVGFVRFTSCVVINGERALLNSC